MTADIVANIKGVDGHIYKAMISAGLYPCTGGADDWLFMKAGIPGFVLELRDSGRQGFIIDSDNIRPNGLELLAAIQTAVKYVKPLSRQMTFPNPNIVQAL